MTKVITYGTFDLFHEGHYNLLMHAKELGDYLIVGVTTQHFDEGRGKVNIIDPIMTRIEHVKATGFADEIIVEDHEGQKIEDIQKYKADIFTVGSDWVCHFDYLKSFCKVVYLPRTPGISSSLKRAKSIVNLGVIGTGRLGPRFLEESRYVSGIEIIAAFNPNKTDGTAHKYQKVQNIPVEQEDFDAFLGVVDAEAEIKSYERKIEGLREDYDAMKADRAVIQEKLDKAYEESNKLYLQTIQSTGGVKILSNVEKK